MGNHTNKILEAEISSQLAWLGIWGRERHLYPHGNALRDNAEQLMRSHIANVRSLRTAQESLASATYVHLCALRERADMAVLTSLVEQLHQVNLNNNRADLFAKRDLDAARSGTYCLVMRLLDAIIDDAATPEV